MVPEGVPEAAEPPKIRHDDLIRYMALDETLDEAVVDEIHRQCEISGSPVQRWVAEMEAKCKEPFNVDLEKIMEVTDDDEHT